MASKPVPRLLCTCPYCAGRFAPSLAFCDEDGKQFGLVCARMEPKLGVTVWNYLRLHGRPELAVTTRKALEIALEIEALASAKTMELANHSRPNSPQYWVQAMQKMLDKPPADLPLTDLNYLRRVAFARAAEAPQLAARPANVSTTVLEQTGGSPLVELTDAEKLEHQRLFEAQMAALK